MKITEQVIQAKLMFWIMHEKKHFCVVPNATNVFWWECDILSMTYAHLLHEFEIKLSKADYKKDFQKYKHSVFGDKSQWADEIGYARSPSYFWFVTYGVRIDPPEYAGWIGLLGDPEKPTTLRIDVRKEAPRLHKQKPTQKQMLSMGRSLAFRLTNTYMEFLNKKEIKNV